MSKQLRKELVEEFLSIFPLTKRLPSTQIVSKKSDEEKVKKKLWIEEKRLPSTQIVSENKMKKESKNYGFRKW